MGTWFKAVVAHFLGVPLELFQRIEVAPASRSVLRLFATDVRVDGLNLPPQPVGDVGANRGV